jgi:hypothetical protein
LRLWLHHKVVSSPVLQESESLDMRTSSFKTIVISCCVGLALSGCGASTVGTSTGSWSVYDLGAGMENPATGIGGTVEIRNSGEGSNVKLSVTGVKASREFGAHVHVGACADANMAAGHYQHNMRPADAGATDPAFANNDNEVWLDFTSDASGKASSEKTTTFRLDNTRAKAVIIHTNKTGAGGVAGAKLACIGLQFN